MSAHGIRFAAPEIDTAALQAVEEPDRRQADGRPHDPRQAAQGRGDARPGAIRLAAPRRGRAADGTTTGRSASTTASSPPAPSPRASRACRTIRASSIRPARSTSHDMPKRLLVIGGGIIGLEMACVYDALGSEVSVVELTDTLMPGCDRDLVRPLEKRLRARYAAILTGTKVTGGRGADARACASRSRARTRRRAADLRPRAVRRRARAERQADRRRGGGRRGRRARLHPGRPPDAHQRAAHLRDRRHRRPADAGPQGDARGQGRGRGRGRPEARLRRARDPVGRLHGSRRSPGCGVTETEAKANGQQAREGPVPVDGERPLARAQSRRRLHEAAVRPGDAPRRRRRHRRQRTPAT